MAIHPDRKPLATELAIVADRQPNNFYKQPGGQDERKYPLLAGIVKTIKGEKAWRNAPGTALIDVLREAIKALDEKMSARLPEDDPLEPHKPPRQNMWAGAPERYMAEILYGFRDDELPVRLNEDGSEARKSYNKDHRLYALRHAGAEHWKERNQDKMLQILRQDLATILLGMQQKAIEDRQRTDDQNNTSDSSTATDPTLIPRPEYVTRVWEQVLSEDKKRAYCVCIWGEPGVGKTVVADQFAAWLDMEPVARIRAGDPTALRRDVLDVLILQGMEPTNWSDAYCQAMLKKHFAVGGEKLRSRIIIIDNVEDEAIIEALVPEAPRAVFLVTMRNKPVSTSVRSVEIDDFTEDQALSFISAHLPRASPADTLALARVLGCRPLALDHAVRFIQESRGVTIQDLVDRLNRSVTVGLNLVVRPVDARRNLVILYKLVLATVLEQREAKDLLDSFLAITPSSGWIFSDLLYSFMHSDFGCRYDRIEFNSGLRVLQQLGLLRGSGSYRELVMHQLTYEILRDLRGSIPFEIEAKYIDFLASEEVTDGTGRTIPEIHQAWLIQRGAELVQDSLPTGWAYFNFVGGGTWLAIHEELDGTKYIARYETRPNGIYKVDYRTGERYPLSADEVMEFANLAILYNDKVSPFLQDVRDWASRPSEDT